MNIFIPLFCLKMHHVQWRYVHCLNDFYFHIKPTGVLRMQTKLCKHTDVETPVKISGRLRACFELAKRREIVISKNPRDYTFVLIFEAP